MKKNVYFIFFVYILCHLYNIQNICADTNKTFSQIDALVSIAYKDSQGILRSIAGGALVHPEVVISTINLEQIEESYFVFDPQNELKNNPKIDFHPKNKTLSLFVLFYLKDKTKPLILEADAYLGGRESSSRSFYFHKNDGSPTIYLRSYIAVLKLKNPEKIRHIQPIALAQENHSWSMYQSPPPMYVGVAQHKKQSDVNSIQSKKQLCERNISAMNIQKTEYLLENFYDYMISYALEYSAPLKKPYHIKYSLNMFPYGSYTISGTNKKNNDNTDTNIVNALGALQGRFDCISKSCTQVIENKQDACYRLPGYPIMIDNHHDLRILGFRQGFSALGTTFQYENILLPMHRSMYYKIFEKYNVLSKKDRDHIFYSNKTLYDTQKNALPYALGHKEYIVSLVTKYDDKKALSFCRGTIIKTGVVLTAAHCMDSYIHQNTNQLYVALSVNRTTIHLKVNRVILHPEYTTNDNEFKTNDYDIALVFYDVNKNTPKVTPAKLISAKDRLLQKLHEPSSMVITTSSYLGKENIIRDWTNTYREYEFMHARHRRNVLTDVQRIQKLMSVMPKQKQLFFRYLQPLLGEDVNDQKFFHGLTQALKNHNVFFQNYCDPKYMLCIEAADQYDMIKRYMFFCGGDSGSPDFWVYKNQVRFISIKSVGSHHSLASSSPQKCSPFGRSTMILPLLPWIRSHVQLQSQS